MVREKKVLMHSLLGQVSVDVRRIATESKERPISRLENLSGVSGELWKQDWSVCLLFSVASQLFRLSDCGCFSHRRMKNMRKDTSVAYTSHSNEVCLLGCVACR